MRLDVGFNLLPQRILGERLVCVEVVDKVVLGDIQQRGRGPLSQAQLLVGEFYRIKLLVNGIEIERLTPQLLSVVRR